MDQYQLMEMFYRQDTQLQEQLFQQNDWRIPEPGYNSSEFVPQEQQQLSSSSLFNTSGSIFSPGSEFFPHADMGFFTSFLSAIGQQHQQHQASVQQFGNHQEFSDNNQFLDQESLMTNDADQLTGEENYWNTTTSTSFELQAPFGFDRDGSAAAAAAAVSSSVSSDELVISSLHQSGLGAAAAAATGEEACYGVRSGEGAGFIDSGNKNEDELSKVEDLSGKAGSWNNRKGRKGLPAKNLMAERRRRKKLNDNLYTLRSVVPKISKMDRTSILGDAVSYVKELQQRIYSLRIENLYSELQPPSVANYATLEQLQLPFQPEMKPQQACLSLPTTVDVQTNAGNTIIINMLCEQRPGLLDSTMRALDGLGVVIQKGEISFVDGFRLEVQAEQHAADQVRPEEIKAVLLHTAGYHSTDF